MRPFRFRLRKLRDHRERVKRERQAALARVDAMLEELRAREAAIDEERARRIERQNLLRRSAVSPASEATFAAYLAHLDVTARDVRARIGAWEAERDRAVLALQEAALDLRVLEKLEERQRAEHEMVENRRDVNELDEIGRDLTRRLEATR